MAWHPGRNEARDEIEREKVIDAEHHCRNSEEDSAGVRERMIPSSGAAVHARQRAGENERGGTERQHLAHFASQTPVLWNHDHSRHVEDEIAPKENAANDQCTGAGAGIEEDARAGDKECGSSYISEPRVSGDPRNYRNHDRMKSSGEGLRRHVGAHQVLNAERSDRDAEYSPAPLGNSIQETLHRRGLL